MKATSAMHMGNHFLSSQLMNYIQHNYLIHIYLYYENAISITQTLDWQNYRQHFSEVSGIMLQVI